MELRDPAPHARVDGNAPDNHLFALRPAVEQGNRRDLPEKTLQVGIAPILDRSLPEGRHRHGDVAQGLFPLFRRDDDLFEHSLAWFGFLAERDSGAKRNGACQQQ